MVTYLKCCKNIRRDEAAKENCHVLSPQEGLILGWQKSGVGMNEIISHNL